MDKMKMHTVDITESNIEKIGQLFPNCLTERIGEDGKMEKVIDFDQLRQELSKEIVEGPQERYQFSWPDKKKAVRLANAPSNMTLRPCREGSIDFDNTENLYIEGDNLEVLKLIREDYLGKVKMIYIDPPYNTGNDFVYADDFSQSSTDYYGNSGQVDELGNRLVQNTESNGRFHTDWLNMIYPRIKVAKDLLSRDGVIFISIDDNEVSNLHNVCNEVFGADNFVANLIWEKKKKPSFLNANLGTKTEFIVCYAKDRASLGALSVELTEEGKKYPFNNAGNPAGDLVFPARSVKFNMPDGYISPQDMSEGKIYTELITPLTVSGGYNENEFTLRGEWRYSQAKLNEIVKEGDEIVISKIPFRPNHVKKGGEIKKMHNLLSISAYGIATNEDATEELTQLFGSPLFDYAKPSELIKLICKSCTYQTKGGIILDFFSGSATTAHAVMKLNAEDGGNRKFIMVQLPEETDPKSDAYKAGYKNICEIGEERIRRGGKKVIEEQHSPKSEGGLFDQLSEDQRIDVGYRLLKLDSSNMNDVYYRPEEFSDQLIKEDNVKEDRTPEDLLFQVMLECNLPLSANIKTEKIAGKEVFSVNNGYLVACFDENVNEEVIKDVAKRKPYFFVMRDSSLASDNVADNFEQIFQAYSKETIRRIL